MSTFLSVLNKICLAKALSQFATLNADKNYFGPTSSIRRVPVSFMVVAILTLHYNECIVSMEARDLCFYLSPFHSNDCIHNLCGWIPKNLDASGGYQGFYDRKKKNAGTLMR